MPFFSLEIIFRRLIVGVVEFFPTSRFARPSFACSLRPGSASLLRRSKRLLAPPLVSFWTRPKFFFCPVSNRTPLAFVLPELEASTPSQRGGDVIVAPCGFSAPAPSFSGTKPLADVPESPVEPLDGIALILRLRVVSRGRFASYQPALSPGQE